MTAASTICVEADGSRTKPGQRCIIIPFADAKGTDSDAPNEGSSIREGTPRGVQREKAVDDGTAGAAGRPSEFRDWAGSAADFTPGDARVLFSQAITRKQNRKRTRLKSSHVAL